VQVTETRPSLDYQEFIVRQALDARRYAIWADTGLGKTAMLLEWARQVVKATGGRVLIFAPTHELIRQHCEEWERFHPASRRSGGWRRATRSPAGAPRRVRASASRRTR
jgi:ERCC4-related helicase